MADPVASGVQFIVAEVVGHRPASLQDFVGRTSFVVRAHNGVRTISGVGSAVGGGVRFQERDVDQEDKDVRTWQIVNAADQGFAAQHVAAF